MNFQDEIELLEVHQGYDENLDPIEFREWIPIGKCLITPNLSAKKTALNDGTEYIYSYSIILRRKKDCILPKEGDTIRIKKKDGTIDKECKVSGFCTYRNNMVNIWV